ncbi:hypothetical protein BEH94_07315 [Candidatus Altiarchaeales archaeon WOR_SM1_SCG]|nr:hypothetical protein BEH94_07315 [Candidatus Altiarchaeales archaeon WOR_SM1_SCG]
MEKLTERIVIDPKVMHGKPVIMGTRVPVEIVLGSLAGGMEVKEVCNEYGLKREDVLAAIDYATKIISNEDVILLNA